MTSIPRPLVELVASVLEDHARDPRRDWGWVRCRCGEVFRGELGTNSGQHREHVAQKVLEAVAEGFR